MALGIYKQGQGYWVRVLTAVFVGVLILAGAQWAWNQAGAVRLPPRSWTYSLVDAQMSSHPEVGDTVVLMGYVGASDEVTELGRASVETYSVDRGSSATLVAVNFSSDVVRDTGGDAVRIVVESSAGSGELGGASVRGATSTPVFPVEYLQTGAAGLVMLLGAIGLLIFVGSNKKSVEFLIATDGEMKKVNWSSYREVKGSTIVVIVATFLIAGLLYGVDMMFSWVFRTIGVLES